jgi:hypothetical protein
MCLISYVNESYVNIKACEQIKSMNAHIDMSVNFWFQKVFKMFLNIFCSKSVHAADNILMSWELLVSYSTLRRVSKTLMIITRLKIAQNRFCISFQKIGGHLKIIGARRTTWSKIHGEDPQILGAPVQDLVAMATLCTSAAWFTCVHSTF